MTYGLPVWFIAILSVGFVLGPILGGVGAIIAARNGRKSDDIRILLNGQTAERLVQARQLGQMEGRAANPPAIIVPPVVAPSGTVVVPSSVTGSDNPKSPEAN